MKRRVTVIGGGVSGLTTALRLLEEEIEVTIVAPARGRATTSGIAAAFWYPYHAWPDAEVVRWSLASLRRFQALAADRRSGVVLREVLEVVDDGAGDPGWREEIEGFRLCGAAELPSGETRGWRFRAPVIDTTIYLPFLIERIRERGGKFIEKSVSMLDGVEGDAIINCTGLGARELTGDDTLYPVRGQLVRTAPGSIHRVTLSESTSRATYVIPRTRDCILGSTTEPGRRDLEADPEQTADIRQRCALLDPTTSGLQELEVLVGLRPGRSAVRVERDIENTRVIHNYGHGGSGFTLSWGCAEDVVRMVQASIGSLDDRAKGGG